MPLITAEGFAEDPFVKVGEDGALPDNGGAIVSLARFQKEREQLIARNLALGVQLKSHENPEILADDIGRFSVIALEFPKFRDGRPFSWARMLRTRLKFTGQIRAVGDYLYDQINYQRRVGFDAWEVPEGFTMEKFRRALHEMTYVYQPSVDGKITVRELRARR